MTGQTLTTPRTQVTSQDGTTIAFTRVGAGPPVILVDGALCDQASGPNGPLAALLADRFTVYTYDRRGRGASGDTAPYAVEREIEDLEALVEEAGGTAYVYGISSGAALAVEAANRLPSITKLVVYEAPFVVDASRKPIPPDYQAHLGRLIADDRRGKAVKYFMTTGVGLPAAMVAVMGVLPMFKRLKAIAHTLPYDAAVMSAAEAGRPLPADRWTSVTAPTLVVGGGKSPAWMQTAQRALADVLPTARHRTLEGQTHMVKPKALAPVVAEFFAAG